MRGRIYRSAKRVFSCKLFDREEFVEATALATLIKGRDHLVVGDYVELEPSDHGVDWKIIGRDERQNEVSRYLPRERKKQVIAANCDLLVILCSLEKPDYKRGLLDRYLLRSIEWEIPALVVFNKADVNLENVDLDFERERLKPLGVESFMISALHPEWKQIDFQKLEEALASKTALFLGQSGVGKSKLISALSRGEVELKSQQLGKVGKGAHTTTWAEIVDVRHFTLMDSPGVRSMSVFDLFSQDLPHYFPDLWPFIQRCQFNDCRHEEDAQGCAFYTEEVSPAILSRLESYRRFQSEMEAEAVWIKRKK